MGDDISNEHMFKTLNAMFSKGLDLLKGKMQPKDCTLYTCTVGRKPSHASYYVNDYKDALMLLSAMVSCSIKIPRNKSADDFMKFGIKKSNPHSSPYAVYMKYKNRSR